MAPLARTRRRLATANGDERDVLAAALELVFFERRDFAPPAHGKQGHQHSRSVVRIARKPLVEKAADEQRLDFVLLEISPSALCLLIFLTTGHGLRQACLRAYDAAFLQSREARGWLLSCCRWCECCCPLRPNTIENT